MSTFNPTTDLAAVADGIGPVRLVRAGSPPEEPGLLVPHAWRRAITAREAAASNGQYTQRDVVWRLPADEIDVPPTAGDVLRDAANQAWTILDVCQLRLQTGWRVTARQVSIAAGLDNRVTILRAAYAKSPSGAAVATWNVWQADVSARIQPLETAVVADEPAVRTVARYLVFVAEDVSLDHDCRLEDADGRQYRVLRVSRAERLGELTTVEAEALG